jgi:hypothetical protein
MHCPIKPLLLLVAGISAVSLVRGGSAARAGSITAESIWDSSNAIQRARSQLSANDTVTSTRCTVVNVRTGSYRYICTLHYDSDPRPTPAPSESNAPAP